MRSRDGTAGNDERLGRDLEVLLIADAASEEVLDLDVGDVNLGAGGVRDELGATGVGEEAEDTALNAERAHLVRVREHVTEHLSSCKHWQ